MPSLTHQGFTGSQGSVLSVHVAKARFPAPGFSSVSPSSNVVTTSGASGPHDKLLLRPVPLKAPADEYPVVLKIEPIRPGPPLAVCSSSDEGKQPVKLLLPDNHRLTKLPLTARFPQKGGTVPSKKFLARSRFWMFVSADQPSGRFPTTPALPKDRALREVSKDQEVGSVEVTLPYVLAKLRASSFCNPGAQPAGSPPDRVLFEAVNRRKAEREE